MFKTYKNDIKAVNYLCDLTCINYKMKTLWCKNVLY